MRSSWASHDLKLPRIERKPWSFGVKSLQWSSIWNGTQEKSFTETRSVVVVSYHERQCRDVVRVILLTRSNSQNHEAQPLLRIPVGSSPLFVSFDIGGDYTIYLNELHFPSIRDFLIYTDKPMMPRYQTKKACFVPFHCWWGKNAEPTFWGESRSAGSLTLGILFFLYYEVTPMTSFNGRALSYQNDRRQYLGTPSGETNSTSSFRLVHLPQDTLD